ncbi:CHAT domain-containing tetratricopeptide repeat protein [Prochlorococcus sp. MIT 1341]|uniref:CHAT domain-containing tetratricopeptide repeat protein n=1 Tax=Prochlorococcus sp. MIT 1341 TaxID=3096221 RepID=UPI002A75F0C4|nr:CHAT domain-containing protein [Prochlorococcus sp. MIT 1341]
MRKQFITATIFLIVTSAALFSGRFFRLVLDNYARLSSSEESSLQSTDKSYQALLPLLEKAKNAKNNEEALQIFYQILSKIESLDTTSKQKSIYAAATLEKIGEYHKALGDFVLAEKSYRQALDLERDLYGKNSPELITNYIDLSALYKSANQYDLAIASNLIALEIMYKYWGKEGPLTYKVTKDLAELLEIKGDLAQAEKFYAIALNGLNKLDKKDLDKVEESILDKIEYGLSKIYIQQGKFQTAEVTLKDLLEQLNPEHKERNTVLRTLSTALTLQGKDQEAEEILLRLLKSSQETLGNDHPATLLNLATLAGHYDSLELFAKALPYYKQLLKYDLSTLEDYLQPSLLNNLGYNFLANGLYSPAEKAFQSSIKLNDILHGKENKNNIKPINSLALLYKLQDKEVDAIDFANKGIKILFKFIQSESQNLSTSERQSFLVSYAGPYMMPFGWALDAKSYNEIALFSRLNHYGLLQELENRQSKLEKLSDEDIQLKKDISLITNQITSPNLLAKERRELEIKRIALEKILYTSLPELEPRIVEVKQIAQVLPKNAVLIEFQKYDIRWKNPFKELESKEGYLSLILKPDGNIDLVDLGPASAIESKINEALFATTQGKDSEYVLWDEVTDLVIKPLQDAIAGSQRLFITADADLNKIPFALLSSVNGEGFLGDDLKIHPLSTGRELLNLNKISELTNNQSLVLANPNFGKKVRYKITQLEQTQKEGEIVANLLKAKLLVSEDATESVIQNLKQPPKVLHIASHAYYDSPLFSKYNNPLLRSGIVLAGVNQLDVKSRHDGFLNALEVSTLDWNGIELVTISGCESGRGDFRFGEGVYGLKRSIAVAGARSSLLSLWEVDDEATSVFMQTFYKRLSNGASKADALALTQRDFRDGRITSSNPIIFDWKKPYYWAAFQLSGDWRPINK